MSKQPTHTAKRITEDFTHEESKLSRINNVIHHRKRKFEFQIIWPLIDLCVLGPYNHNTTWEVKEKNQRRKTKGKRQETNIGDSFWEEREVVRGFGNNLRRSSRTSSQTSI